MTFRGIQWIALYIGIVSSTVYALGPKEKRGWEVARKADAANTGFRSERSSLEMKLFNANNDVTTRRLELEIIEGREDGDRSRVRFDWPADVKGTKLLSWAHKSGPDDQWLFLPAIKRVKRISGRSRTGSFMGSEFSYEDLSVAEIEKYSYKLLGEIVYKGRPCWQLERVPIESNSGYSRQVVVLDKEYNNPLRIDFYDRKKELLKTALFSSYRKYGRFWRADQIEMRNLQTEKRSRLFWKKRKLGVNIDAALFEPTALEE